jgi:site-specific DNA-methyltransferase (adenine-specific)
MPENRLYYGDNLDILRRYIADESVDLIYLDPPFKSNQDYNVLFAEQDGSQAAAQMKAFEDTWHWDVAAVSAYQAVVEGGGRVADARQALHAIIGQNDMLAYLTMMAPRLAELRRVLKPTGSIYLHCDPTASHYLKILMDAVFGPENFRNEVVWKRTHAHGSSKRYGPIHDIILFYARSDDFIWTNPRMPHDEAYIRRHFTHSDPQTNRLFQPITLTGSGVRHGESGKPWRGIDPTAVGRHWALPGSILEQLNITAETVQDRLDALDTAGMIYWPDKEDGVPRLKWYADQLAGQALPDIWADIAPLSAKSAERLDYPTQKPEALLERLLGASSNEGDTILDPFCGCGTTIAAAQKVHRRWIGIDITNLAITLIRHRLQDAFGPQIVKQYKVIGEPVSVPDAAALAEQDRFQFQWWALGLVGARPTPPEQKKGADKGIDGRLYFFDDPQTGKAKQIVFSVKSGHLKATDVRDLRGVIDREKAAIGVLIALEEPTQPMRAEAASAGHYVSPFFGNKRFSRLQILTIEQLLAGRGIDMPPHENISPMGKRAPKAKGRKAVETVLPFDGEFHAEDEAE